jgi:hemoglobin
MTEEDRQTEGLEPRTVYEAVGGTDFFVTLVERFYDGVEGDPVLRRLYPDDLTESKDHLSSFLVQYWGGPTTYSDERGHPRLRMRHFPFAIGEAERDAWLRHMTAAVEAAGLDPEIERRMLDYFSLAATHLVNTSG